MRADGEGTLSGRSSRAVTSPSLAFSMACIEEKKSLIKESVHAGEKIKSSNTMHAGE